MMTTGQDKLPLTVILAVKNEAVNLPRCLAALSPAWQVIVVDSHSQDDSALISQRHGAQVVQFEYGGGYPKKRQWALDNLLISTPWVLLLDADEVVTPLLWSEIKVAISEKPFYDAFIITKEFHFLGRQMRFGGFSHAAVLLFRVGTARFERIFDDDFDGLDMEVHERIVMDGKARKLRTPLIHEDFKGLEAYIDRHNKYSTWEAKLRLRYLQGGSYGELTIAPRLLGNTQERRRALKKVVVRTPLEPWVWFAYHYLVRLGFLEGHRGLVASRLRAAYITQVRAKVFELQRRAP